jgi:hypothetical protein
MSDQIPDAGKMVCPRCGSGLHRKGPGRIRNEFACRSVEWDDGSFSEAHQCCRNQIDQLRARVEEWKTYAEILEQSLVRIANAESAPDIDIGGEMQFGLHCGVEDRGCSDRYDGADYGYSRGVTRALEWAVNEAAHTIAKAKQTKPEGLR